METPTATPTTPPPPRNLGTLTPGQVSTLDAASVGGTSMADLHAARAAQQPAPITPIGDASQLAQGQLDPQFAKGLDDARKTDLAKKAGTVAAQPQAGDDAAAAAAPEPRQSAREALSDWRPKGKQPAKQWDEFKAKKEAEINALKAEIEQYKKGGAAPGQQTLASDELKKLQDELNQYRDLVKQVAIDKDPQFNAKFETQRKAAIKAAVAVVGEDSKLEKLLQQPASEFRDQAIDNIIKNLPGPSQRRVHAALAALDQIDIARSAEIEAAKLTWDQRQQQQLMQHQQHSEARKAKLNQAFDAVHAEWTKEMPFLAQREGDAEHNAMASEAAQLARSIFSGELSDAELATAAHWAAVAPRALQELHAAQQQIEQLRADNDRLRGVTPGDGASLPSGASSGGSVPQPGTDAYDAYFRNQLQQAQQADRNRKGWQ